MSFDLYVDVDTDDIVDFVLCEHELDTGIPVHPFSVVNATFTSYNKMPGITDGKGYIFAEGRRLFKGYGLDNDPTGMIRALRSCGVGFR